jgi:hypothetical protein
VTGNYIAERLRSYRFNFNSEDELQRGVERALERESIPFEREARISDKDRIDFLCSGIGIEIKTQGSRASVLRQVHRYCGLEALSELILLTSRSNHTRGLGDALQGKPVHVVYVGVF